MRVVVEGEDEGEGEGEGEGEHTLPLSGLAGAAPVATGLSRPTRSPGPLVPVLVVPGAASGGGSSPAL